MPAPVRCVTFRMPALLARRVFRRRAGLPTPCSYCRTSTASQHRHGHSAAEEASIAVGPHVTIVSEPRGNVVGYAPDHRGGPDMVVIDSKTVIDFKSSNPNAKRNQAKLTRDLKANLRASSASRL